MVALIKFFIGPVGRWILVAAAVAVLAFAAVKAYDRKIASIEQRGWNRRDVIAKADDAKREAETKRVLEEERKRLEDYNRELGERLAAERTKVADLELKLKRLFAQLRKEVKTYVTKEDDARIAACGGVPRGFVVLHDRAARGDPGEATVPTEAEHREQRLDSGVALSQVAEATVENYEKFHRCMNSLRAWENWYDIAHDTYTRNIK